MVGTVVDQERGYPGRYWDCAMAWMIRGSNDGRQGQALVLFSRTPRRFVGPTQSPSQWVPAFFPGCKTVRAEVECSVQCRG